jgi:uncharacterized repeat protein (TIGR03803 family)
MKLARTANVRQVGNSGRTQAAPALAYSSIGNLWTAARAAVITTTIATTLLLICASQVCAAVDVTVMHAFTGGKDGAFLDSNLVADAAGNFYGTTQIGGAYGWGTVFELSPNQEGKWRFSLLYTFTGAADGGNPLGSLVFDAAGNAYATASSGGANGFGVVFELSPPPHAHGEPWSEKVLYSFQGGSDGAIPFGNVVFDAAGNLYGTTSIGGHSHIGCLAGCGTIYELSPTGNGSWNEKVLHRLIDAFGQGAEPRAGLVMDAAGNLYGTTYEGGNNSVCGGLGCGSVFELTPPASGKKHWGFKNLIDFNGIDGALIRGGLTLSSGGALYGTTLYGGADNRGIVFSFTQESGHWKFQTVYSFNGLYDGLQPSGNLALDNAGNVYGATYEGGANDWGSLFQLVPSANGWTENLLYSLPVSGRRVGSDPLGGVIIDATGNIYLTTNQGGNLHDCQEQGDGCGAVIKLSSTIAP